MSRETPIDPDDPEERLRRAVRVALCSAACRGHDESVQRVIDAVGAETGALRDQIEHVQRSHEETLERKSKLMTDWLDSQKEISLLRLRVAALQRALGSDDPD